jgi:hypothetical protein
VLYADFNFGPCFIHDFSTLTTGTSTKPTVASTTMTPKAIKSTTTINTSSKATTPATPASGRRKRDVENGKPAETDGTLYNILI